MRQSDAAFEAMLWASHDREDRDSSNGSSNGLAVMRRFELLQVVSANRRKPCYTTLSDTNRHEPTPQTRNPPHNPKVPLRQPGAKAAPNRHGGREYELVDGHWCTPGTSIQPPLTELPSNRATIPRSHTFSQRQTMQRVRPLPDHILTTNDRQQVATSGYNPDDQSAKSVVNTTKQDWAEPGVTASS